MSLKNCNFKKKGIGIESQNLCKQFNDQKTQSYGCYRRKVNSEAFVIPILTAKL